MACFSYASAYHTHARDVIRSGLGRPVDYQMLIEDTKFSASEQLVEEFALDDVEKVWQELGDEYFLKESADEIAWHTRAILQHGDNPEPLVLMRAQRKFAQDAVQIFIYTQDQPNLFATTVGYCRSYESGCTRCTYYYRNQSI